VDLTLTGNVPYAYCASLYMAQSGNPTLGYASAISVYIDNLGSACADLAILDLQQAITALTGGLRSCYIRVRRQAAYTLKGVVRAEGTAATNLVSTDSTLGGFGSTQAGGSLTITHKIAVDFNGTTRYIAVGTIA